LANEAEIIPFPNDEVTPPVTKIYLVMIFLKNGCGFKPKPNVCVRDTKVRKFSGFALLVEKKRQGKGILSTISFLNAFIKANYINVNKSVLQIIVQLPSLL
jgi:hypothetical protein